MFAIISGQIASEVHEEQTNDGTVIKKFIVSVHKEFNGKGTIHEFPVFIYGKYADCFDGQEGDEVILECEPKSKTFQSKAGKECFDIQFRVNKFTVIPAMDKPKFAGVPAAAPAPAQPAQRQAPPRPAQQQAAKTLSALPKDETSDEIPF